MMDHMLDLVHALVLALILLATDLTIFLGRGSHDSLDVGARVLSLNDLRSGGWTESGLVLLRSGWIGAS